MTRGRRPRLRRLVDAQAGKPEQPLHADPLRVELVAGRQDLEQVLDLERRAGLDQDVVEVSPPYDHADITAALGNGVVLESLSAIARRRKDERDGTTWDPTRPLLDR